jgi:hypothetical protein
MSTDIERELGRFENDPDSGKAGLARAIRSLLQVWRGLFGTIPGIAETSTAVWLTPEGNSAPRWSLETGGHKNIDELERALKSSGIKVSEWAKNMMETPEYTVVPRNWD